MDAIKKPAHYNQGTIECIDAMKIVLTPEEFRGYLKGNVFKYLWREKDKNGIEDLRKGREYYDRLIQLSDEGEQRKEADIKSLMDYPFGEREPVNKQSSTAEPPDGWRWLEVGEVIRKGDLPCKDGLIYATEPIMLGMALQEHWKPMIRRNKFEVGEKVVRVDDKELIPYEIYEYIQSKDAYVVKYEDGHYMYHWSKLAPYIEEQS